MIRFNTLYSKLALVFACSLLVVGTVCMLLATQFADYYQRVTEQQFNRNLAYNLVQDQQLISGGKLDNIALKKTFQRYMNINPSIEIYLLDAEGNILTYSADPGAVQRKQVALEPIRRFLAGEDFVLGDDPRNQNLQKSFSVTPLLAANNTTNYLYVILRGEIYDTIQQLHHARWLSGLAVLGIGLSLICGLLGGLWGFALVTRRLRLLTQQVDRFHRNGFTYYPAPKSPNSNTRGDDIDQLRASFDQMAQHIQNLLAALNKRDELRRELVSHVSHDLRTPLTCLHAYLETLKLKDQQLNPEQRQVYIDAALGHSTHLGSLVNELFELAKLDAGAIEPQIEAFAPAELLHDIGQKFQPKAHEQGVELNVVSPDFTSFAAADIGLLERALENLLANALYHTPKGGRIELILQNQAEHFDIMVKDTGSGIAAEDLPYIFDRFYQGNRANKRAHQEGHVGLGLAIAKSIIELHQSQLSVSSTPEGTCFTFQLALGQT